jgi:hypothetical protein
VLQDKDAALRLGREAGQLAIYDLSRREVVYVDEES